METPIRPTDLASAASVSVSYASQIISGKREPSQALAIEIWRKTGHKFGPLAHATDDEATTIAALVVRQSGKGVADHDAVDNATPCGDAANKDDAAITPGVAA